VRRTTALLAAVALLAAAVASSVQHRGPAPAARSTVRLVPQARLGAITARRSPPTTASCLARTSGRVTCYEPAQIRAGYDLAPLYARGVDGRGETIVVVDAFGSPTITADLASFDAAFHLPAPPSFKVITPAGPIPAFGASGKDRPGWASETSLDVEWAHALAPGASILLVETPTDEVEGTSGFPDIVTAERYVVTHRLGTVISQSFGATEQTFHGFAQLSPLRSAYVAAAAAGISVVSGSGDLGATDFKSTPPAIYTSRVTSWPASDPLVTAVGGTRVDLDASGRAIARAVTWNDRFPQLPSVPDASGGGRSVFFARPAWQRGVAQVVGAARGVPDVSMSASCTAVVDTYVSFPGTTGNWETMCGTSEAAPLFAAIVALADEEAGHGLGVLNPALYALSAAHAAGIVDVVSGNNTVSWAASATRTDTVTGFRATAGYDLATGVGTVDAARFVPELVAESRALAAR